MRRLLIVATVAAAALAGCGGGTARREGGPLEAGPSHRLSIAGKLGTRYTYADLYMQNRGHEPVVLEGVRLRKRSPGLRLLSVSVAGEDRPLMGGASDKYPARYLVGTTRPLAGYRVEPNDPKSRGTAFVLGVRPERAGRHLIVFDGVDILYRQGDRRYVRHVDTQFVLCMVERPPYVPTEDC